MGTEPGSHEVYGRTMTDIATTSFAITEAISITMMMGCCIGSQEMGAECIASGKDRCEYCHTVTEVNSFFILGDKVLNLTF